LSGLCNGLTETVAALHAAACAGEEDTTWKSKSGTNKKIEFAKERNLEKREVVRDFLNLVSPTPLGVKLHPMMR
jgi:hypothetical protein